MQAWEEFLQQQDRDVGTQTVGKWLRPLNTQRFETCHL